MQCLHQHILHLLRPSTWERGAFLPTRGGIFREANLRFSGAVEGYFGRQSRILFLISVLCARGWSRWIDTFSRDSADFGGGTQKPADERIARESSENGAFSHAS